MISRFPGAGAIDRFVREFFSIYSDGAEASFCFAGQLDNLSELEPGNFCLCMIRQTLPVWCDGLRKPKIC